MAQKRVKPGHFVEVSTPGGLAYVQYVSRHPEYGDTIRVLPGLFRSRPVDWARMAGEHDYFAFYPVSAALRQGLVEIVATEPIPENVAMPEIMRRPGARSSDGRVVTWIVIDGNAESVRHELSAEERRLPIAVIWNHELLVQRLAEKWHPERES